MPSKHRRFIVYQKGTIFDSFSKVGQGHIFCYNCKALATLCKAPRLVVQLKGCSMHTRMETKTICSPILDTGSIIEYVNVTRYKMAVEY